jgi:hypothetical protein
MLFGGGELCGRGGMKIRICEMNEKMSFLLKFIDAHRIADLEVTKEVM